MIVNNIVVMGGFVNVIWDEDENFILVFKNELFLWLNLLFYVG